MTFKIHYNGNTDHSLHYLKSLATRLHRKNCIGEKGELKVFVDDKLKAHKHIPFDDKWATV